MVTQESYGAGTNLTNRKRTQTCLTKSSAPSFAPELKDSGIDTNMEPQPKIKRTVKLLMSAKSDVT